jgi:hypothetical protein
MDFASRVVAGQGSCERDGQVFLPDEIRNGISYNFTLPVSTSLNMTQSPTQANPYPMMGSNHKIAQR